jgi:hypothetical protein
MTFKSIGTESRVQISLWTIFASYFVVGLLAVVLLQLGGVALKNPATFVLAGAAFAAVRWFKIDISMGLPGRHRPMRRLADAGMGLNRFGEIYVTS